MTPLRYLCVVISPPQEHVADHALSPPSPTSPSEPNRHTDTASGLSPDAAGTASPSSNAGKIDAAGGSSPADNSSPPAASHTAGSESASPGHHLSNTSSAKGHATVNASSSTALPIHGSHADGKTGSSSSIRNGGSTLPGGTTTGSPTTNDELEQIIVGLREATKHQSPSTEGAKSSFEHSLNNTDAMLSKNSSQTSGHNATKGDTNRIVSGNVSKIEIMPSSNPAIGSATKTEGKEERGVQTSGKSQESAVSDAHGSSPATTSSGSSGASRNTSSKLSTSPSSSSPSSSSSSTSPSSAVAGGSAGVAMASSHDQSGAHQADKAEAAAHGIAAGRQLMESSTTSSTTSTGAAGTGTSTSASPRGSSETRLARASSAASTHHMPLVIEHPCMHQGEFEGVGSALVTTP